MTQEEKIILLQSLLRTLVYLPNNSGISVDDAAGILEDATKKDNEGKIDEYITILSETLEKIGLKMQDTNHRANKIYLTDMENLEKDSETSPNSLLTNF